MNYELITAILLEKIEILQKDYDHVNNDSKTYWEELQKALDNSKIWYGNAVAFQQKAEAFEKERDALQNDLQEQIDAGIWLKGEIDKVVKHRDVLFAENNKLILERDQLRSDIARITKNWDICDNNLNEVGASNRQLLSKTEALQSLVDELRLENKIAAKRNAELTENLQTAKTVLQKEGYILVDKTEYKHE